MSNSGSRGLSDLSLRELCRALAARRPTPSGGSLAAGVGALGAAGISMTLRFAEGEGQAWQQGRGDELEAIALRLCDLVERDAAIYDRVVAAKALPEGEPAARALERAFREALETPIEMMEACLGALRIASAGASLGVPAHLACDCLAGAHALSAALEDAYLMVRENAGCLGAGEEVAALLSAAEAMRAEAARQVQSVRLSAEGVRR
jgi:glutamate formiminotransferase/formiminotetrahydrofolate cyclodeaminase